MDWIFNSWGLDVALRVEQGFYSFFAQFLMIFQSSAHSTLKIVQKYEEKLCSTSIHLISCIDFWSRKPDFRDPVHH